jgi:small subunit ribosomal protein S5
MRTDDIGWVPKTRLGRKVMNGEIKTMSEALRSGLSLRESEIVDMLLPTMEDEVLDVNMVQRMTDSGRRVNFVITTVVGNGDGFVGLGRARGKEVGPSIRKSIENAKKNIIEIRRGCGSWECGCATPHSLPFLVTGRSGSVKVTLKPAPRGVALAVGDVAKHILRVAGIKDAWGFTKGHTKTTVNYALATFNALKESSTLKVNEDQKIRLRIMSGSQPVIEPEIPLEEEGEEQKETEKEGVKKEEPMKKPKEEKEKVTPEKLKAEVKPAEKVEKTEKKEEKPKVTKPQEPKQEKEKEKKESKVERTEEKTKPKDKVEKTEPKSGGEESKSKGEEKKTEPKGEEKKTEPKGEEKEDEK